MNEVKLLPHNEEAYSKLVDCLAENQMASINHATGTGKSFIILKYLNEHKDKRILYLAPTYQIIDQLLEDHMSEIGIDVKSFKTLDAYIYANLMNKDMEEIANKYDIIILDEYHRCGAPKWGMQVNKLLEYIKTRYPNKKVIGTTATEIRFLDNEKNMNNILFNGVCASRLSLADAILNGILPVPIYINAIFDLYQTLDSIEVRVKNKCFHNDDVDKILSEINTIRKYLDDAMSKVEDMSRFIGEDGKYLVFSSKIDCIDKDKNTIRKIFKNKIDNEFVVHSSIKKEKNKISLDNFKKINKGNNFLYSINLLNEGLHVKDIDAIFMLRKTTSPIIYFQQLGRLLSYSKRKETVVVFDLVNNVKNNPYIYYLYEEIYQRAQQLMIENPQNKDKYQEILDKFRIVNLTSSICELIDKLSEKTTINKLKVERLNVAVLILEGKRHSTPFEKQQAQVDIFKFKKFIDVDLFNRIKQLNVRKPKIFNLTQEEYKIYLENKSFREKFDNENRDDNLTIVSNEQLFSSKYEKVLSKVDLELSKSKDKDEYINNLYFELINFVKNNYRQPRCRNNISKNNSKIDYENELYYKKIIFYNDLNIKGYIKNLQDLEDNLVKNTILIELAMFVEQHNGDFPTSKLGNDEGNLLKRINRVDHLFNDEDLKILKKLLEKQKIRAREVVALYVQFIKKYKRYPLKDSKNEYEKKLFNSFIRNEELFTEEEKKIIKDTYLSINKKEIIKNSYVEMLKNRK